MQRILSVFVILLACGSYRDASAQTGKPAPAITLDMLQPDPCFEAPNQDCLTNSLASTITDLKNNVGAEDMQERAKAAFAGAPYLVALAQQKLVKAADLPADKSFMPFVLAQEGYQNWPFVMASILELGNADQAYTFFETIQMFGKGIRNAPSAESLTFRMADQFGRFRNQDEVLAEAAKLLNKLTDNPEAVASALLPFARAADFTDQMATQRLLAIWPKHALHVLPQSVRMPPEARTWAWYQRIYGMAATPEAKRKFAEQFKIYGLPTDATTAQCLTVMENAGKSDIHGLLSLYLRAFERKDDVALAAQKAEQAQLPPGLAPWFTTYRTFILLHMKGQLAEQIPAIVDIFKSAPDNPDHPEAASKLAEIMALDPSIPIEPLVAAMPELNAAWRPKHSGAISSLILRLTHLMLLREDPGLEPFLRSLPMNDVAASFHPKYISELISKGYTGLADEIVQASIKRDPHFPVQLAAQRFRDAVDAGDVNSAITLLKNASSKERVAAIGSYERTKRGEAADTKILLQIAEAWPADFFLGYVSSDFHLSYNPAAPVPDAVMERGARQVLNDPDGDNRFKAQSWFLHYALSTRDVPTLLSVATLLRASGSRAWPHLVGKAAFLIPRS